MYDKNYIYNEVIDLNYEIVVFKKTGCRQYSITISYAGRQKEFHLDYRGTKLYEKKENLLEKLRVEASKHN